MKILFVDDEKMILDGIKRLLFGSGWQIRLANGGEEGMALLSKEHVDVVISDMRMPGMNGEEFLGKVREVYPDTVRVVLSGYADQDASLKASFVAHQWLDKPCKKESLISTLKDIESVIAGLPSPEIRSVVGQVSTLPTPPKMFAKIRSLTESGGSTIEDVAAVVSEDPSLSAKVLQLTNSSFFCRGAPVVDIGQAIIRLGYDLVNGIVLLSETYSKLPEDKLIDVDEEQMRSLVISQFASGLVDENLKQSTYLAGLLHRLGKFILVQVFPHASKEYESRSQSLCYIDSILLEEEIFGVNHAQLGAYLLFLWGFPHAIVETVLYYQSLDKLTGNHFEAPCAIYVASTLFNDEELDQAFMAHFKLEDKIFQWKEMLNDLKEQR